MSNYNDIISDAFLQTQAENLQQSIVKLKENYANLLKELYLFASNGDLSENADWSLVNERKEILFQEICQKEIQLAGMRNNSMFFFIF